MEVIAGGMMKEYVDGRKIIETTDMEVIAGGMMKEYVDGRKKRNRPEEESVDIFERLIRDRDDSLKMSLRNDFESPSPKFAPWLAFTLEPKMIEINDLTTKVENGLSDNQLGESEIANMTEEMSKLIDEDRCLGDHLQESLLLHLVGIIEHKQNSILQAHAAMILQSVVAYSKHRGFVLELIRTRSVVNLIHSKICEVQVKALGLLRTIAEFSKPGEWIEEAVTPLVSLLADQSPNDEVLISGYETLSVFCQVYPQLPPDKLKLVLDALLDLIIEYDDAEILPFACLGLVYHCDGTKRMVVPEERFDRLIDRFAVILERCTLWMFREESIAAITALGAIVRWGSCSHIEVIIKKKAVLYLMFCLYDNNLEMWFLKNSCWIISNIIAKTENLIEAVVDFELIEGLVDVVEKYEFLDVKKEAAWAIANAIFGAEHQIEHMKLYCLRPLWFLVQSFYEDREMVSICLRALIKLEGVEVTCNGRRVDVAKIKEASSQDDIIWLTKLKKLRQADNIKRLDGEIVFQLTLKIQGAARYGQIMLVDNRLEDVLMYLWDRQAQNGGSDGCMLMFTIDIIDLFVVGLC